MSNVLSEVIFSMKSFSHIRETSLPVLNIRQKLIEKRVNRL